MKTVLALTTGVLGGLIVGMFTGAFFLIAVEDSIDGSVYHTFGKYMKPKVD